MEYSDSHNKPNATHQEHNLQKHRQPSTSELISSAKLVAEAAKYSLSHETDKVDKGRVAGAAEDLLGAASHYGKLEEKSFGKYVEKAETYLHQYHSSHSSTTSTGSGHSATHTAHSAPHSSGDDGHSGSGHADGHSGSGGYGDYLKMAEGFLKKR
ncbi:nodulin-related protein 1 [Juglans microcarpa x Juglans regia]|uniref:nodulin-related protein 1 n=1 Tax=Juglans microcarpa x Juglans regia TaxID=2249226 RepID=UPI001B7EE996|nr:nodulin-related protein 1 [Juglans microcarpa x Juglans regia]